MSARGRLFVIAAPSGAGKTSLVRALMQRDPALRFSISYTTRPPRQKERPNHDYHFVRRDEFERMVAQGDFLEHADVFGNLYGTSRRLVEDMLARGENVILEIDWQGARQVRAAMPEAVTIFILPPSQAELERRLRDRRTDSEDVIRRRLADSIADMSHWTEFDHVVVNDAFDAALADLESVVAGRGAHLRSGRAELAALMQQLLRSG
jgi:guanylate kinase